MAFPLDYLVLETGAGVDDANTWIDVTWADSYHAARNRTTWSPATDEVKVAGVLFAAQWLRATYTFRGSQTDRARLPYPAVGAYDDRSRLISGVPEELQRAQAELAFDHAITGNTLDEPLDRALSELKVGPVTLKWADWEPQGVTRELVEAELEGIIEAGGLGASVPLAAGFY